MLPSGFCFFSGPSPFFVNAAFKGLNDLASRLESTVAMVLVNVASKGLTFWERGGNRGVFLGDYSGELGDARRPRLEMKKRQQGYRSPEIS
jgi:hypothetical protein